MAARKAKRAKRSRNLLPYRERVMALAAAGNDDAAIAVALGLTRAQAELAMIAWAQR